MSTDTPSYLDRKVMLQRVDGEIEILQEVIAVFFDTYPEQLETIREALCAENFAEAERSAHALKGSLQIFFKGEVIRLAYETEIAARASAQSDALNRLLELRNELSAIRPLLDELKEYL